MTRKFVYKKHGNSSTLPGSDRHSRIIVLCITLVNLVQGDFGPPFPLHTFWYKMWYQFQAISYLACIRTSHHLTSARTDLTECSLEPHCSLFLYLISIFILPWVKKEDLTNKIIGIYMIFLAAHVYFLQHTAQPISKTRYITGNQAAWGRGGRKALSFLSSSWDGLENQMNWQISCLNDQSRPLPDTSVFWVWGKSRGRKN